MAMIFGVIYLVVNNVNGKMYVGQTVESVKKRWSVHCGPLSRCFALSNAIAKYGQESFSIGEIDTAKSTDELNRLEDHYVRLYETLAPNGYNLKEGGGSKGKWSEEVRQKIKASHNSPEFKVKLKENSVAMWQRPETRKKISDAIRKGLNVPDVKAKRSAGAKIVSAKPEVKERMSKAQVDRYRSDVEREKISAWSKARWADNAARTAMLEAHSKAMSAPDHRKRVSEDMKRLWQDPEYRAHMTQRLVETRRRKTVFA